MARINAVRAEAFADLNAEQRAAVEHGPEPLLVIAGSGKTKTLSCRVARIWWRRAPIPRAFSSLERIAEEHFKTTA
jgi:UvrD/REP helicase N-terminal domain